MTDMVMRASPDQKKRTKMSEGLRLDAYLDTQDPPHWTIGYGRADTNPKPVRGLVDGKFYQGKPCKNLQITQAEADRLFEEDADDTERTISEATDHHLTQSQFDALFDFVHHYGANNFLGSTLLKRINFNPTNLKAILPEFARWNINAGRRDKGIYMRACRRACVYAGAPIPQILWEPRNFPWKVTADDEIDFNQTPDAFFLVELGKDKAKPYVFDPDKIETPPRDSLEPAGKIGAEGGSPTAQNEQTASATTAGPLEGVGAQVDPSPPASPIAADPDDDELILRMPAAPPPSPDKVPAPSVSTVESGAGQEGAAVAVSLPDRAPPPKASTTVIAGTEGTKPPSVWTRQSNEVDYKIDPNAGLKPIEDSDRGRAFVAQRLSVWVIRAGSGGLFGTGFKGASDWLQQDATLFAMTMELWVPAVLSGVTLGGGLISKARADWRRVKANREASQGLY